MKYYLKTTIDESKLNYHMVSFQGGENENRLEYIFIGGLENSPSNNNSNINPPRIDFKISRLGGNIIAGSYSTTLEVDMLAHYFMQTPVVTSPYYTNWANDLFVFKIDTFSKQSISGSFSITEKNLSGKTININYEYSKLLYEEVINT